MYKMDSELKSKYCNITNETIRSYLNLCTHCQQKFKEHIYFSAFNSRAQINVINMQSQNMNGFHYILNYQNYLTIYNYRRISQLNTVYRVI